MKWPIGTDCVRDFPPRRQKLHKPHWQTFLCSLRGNDSIEIGISGGTYLRIIAYHMRKKDRVAQAMGQIIDAA